MLASVLRLRPLAFFCVALVACGRISIESPDSGSPRTDSGADVLADTSRLDASVDALDATPTLPDAAADRDSALFDAAQDAAPEAAQASDVCTPSMERCNGVDDNCNSVVDDVGTCPDTCTGVIDPVSGKEYALCTSSLTRDAASSVCREMGMDLIEVNGLSEHNLMVRTISRLTTEPATFTWLGGSDRGTDGDFRWRSTGELFWRGGPGGAAVGGSFANWTTGQPERSTAECMGFLGAGSRWQVADCASSAFAFCERRTLPSCEPSTTPERCNGLDDNCDSRIDEGSVCEPDCTGRTLENGTSFVLCRTGLSRAAQRTSCARMGGSLASIRSSEENEAIYSFGVDVGVPGNFLGFGAADDVEEGTWRTEEGEVFWLGAASGTALAYANFATGEPNDVLGNPGEDCGFMAFGSNQREWGDIACTSTMAYICRLASPVVCAAAESCNGLDDDCDGVIDDGACPIGCRGSIDPSSLVAYAFCSPTLDYTAARTNCESIGMNLAAIETASESTYLDFRVATRLGGSASVWIGAESGSDTVWRWRGSDVFWTGTATGSAASGRYTRWGVGAPSPVASRSCAYIATATGTWMDDAACDLLAASICEAPRP